MYGTTATTGSNTGAAYSCVGTSKRFHILVRNAYSHRLVMPHSPPFSQVFCRPKGSVMISWLSLYTAVLAGQGSRHSEAKGREAASNNPQGRGASRGWGGFGAFEHVPLTSTHDGTFTSVFSRAFSKPHCVNGEMCTLKILQKAVRAPEPICTEPCVLQTPSSYTMSIFSRAPSLSTWLMRRWFSHNIDADSEVAFALVVSFG